VFDERQPLFIVTTPFDMARVVVCWQDTWDIHIPAIRQDLGPQIVMGTLESPSLILQGTTESNYVIYLNQEFTSPGGNSPLAIIVDPNGNPMAAVASFGFRRDFRDITQHTVIWMP
jgi:hypothetical protein